MHTLEGYQNLDQIYESNRSLVYRAFDEKNNRSVILKVFDTGYATPEEISRSYQEYELISLFKNEGVIQAFGLLKADDLPVIVMEDIDGQSLADTLNSKKLNLGEFLNLSSQIAEMVANIHKHNIIHKDINPSNIIWNIEKNIVRIIDLGIATKLPREVTSVKNPKVLEGTLAFISPEQTGRMNRSLDYRTDFYSLGVTFYWMLTGQLPFESTDLIKLVHSHIAIRPVPPHEIDESIPVVVSEIVMKLMAKNAEDRYLSAHGLKVDLERCRQELREKGVISTFRLGIQDVSAKFQIPQKLYGREQEVDTLTSTFERVRKGNTELMLVSGFSGIGKSSLINEIHKPISEHSGYFISGKFEKLKKDVPYSAIIQAFTGLASQILAEDEAEINVWKEKLLSALGLNGKIITDMVPMFELIIDKQPAVPTLQPVESQNRFNLVFQRFIKIMASKKHPLVVFLDDLQWADLASLHLLKLFATDSNIKHLFMIGAYRHNETPDSHPLILTLEEIKKTGTIVNTLFLQPLSSGHISQLLADTLNFPTKEINSLADLLILKTRGNPFFLNEFLQSLNKERLIDFSFENGWSWQMSAIESMQATDNVVNLMLGKIRELPENSQKLLKLGACIGSQFNLATLATVSGEAKETILAALNPVLLEGLLIKIDNTYRFGHDRVYEVTYSLIPNEEKVQQHYRIGNLELKNLNKQELQGKIFYIVNQLNAGMKLVTEESEKFNLAKLNLLAGKKALTSNAYASSLTYLMAGLELLSEDCWQVNYDMTLALYQEAISAAQLNADYVLMDKMAEKVIQNARTILDSIKVYQTKIYACQAQNQLIEGIRIGLNVLKQLGVKLPEKPGKLRIVYELLLLKLFLLGKSVENFKNLSEVKDPHILAIMQISSSIGSSAYWASPELLPLLVFNIVRLSVKNGLSVYSPYAFASFGLIHCGVLGDINTGYKWGKLALNIVDQFNIREIKSRVWMVFWYLISHWKSPLRNSIEPLHEAHKIGIEEGDLEFATNSSNARARHLFFSGLELSEVEKEIANHVEMCRKFNQDTILNFQLITHQTVLNLQGMSEDSCKLIGSAYDETKMIPVHKEANDRSALCFLYSHLLNLNYLFENFKEAFKYSELVNSYIDASISSPYVPQFYFYDALTRLAHCPPGKRSPQKRILKKVFKNQKKIKKWAFHAPMNYGHKYHLVEAEIARVLGQKLKAMDHFKLAVKLARENKFLNEEALALKLTAKFWLEINEEKIAAIYMTEAHRAYRRWGAIAIMKHMEAKYGNLLELNAEGADPSTATSTADSCSSETVNLLTVAKSPHALGPSAENKTVETLRATSTGSVEFLDMSTVTKASQAISSEMDLEKLLDKMIRIIMENAGAVKGYILLNKNKGLLIEAAANTSTKEILVLESIRVDESKDLSKGIVNYVLRTGQSVVLPNENDNNLFINDPYLKANHPKSVLCIPMRYMDKTTGILYLENNLTENAFTKQRIETLNILLSQAVISLENAFIYNHLDELVKERTAQLIAAQAELIENAHKAGMADIATGTLHNIGNILNSVRISTEFIRKTYNPTAFFDNFKTANKLLRDNLDNIEEFIISNPKGKKLIQYYLILEKEMDQDISKVKAHIERLAQKVDVMADVVSAQQSYAGAAPLIENCSLSAIIEDALTMQQESLSTDDISIEKNFTEIPKIPVHKTKLIHILINLIKNAREAMTDKPTENRKLTFTVFSEDENAFIKIKDTGCGILPENLRKIFSHGYTTKKDGHGFGLHSSANYMTEMKGRMWAESDGEGKGAVFVLKFPVK